MTGLNQSRLATYLGHILEAIGRCQAYVEDYDEVSFLTDPKTQDAVIRAFEVIGEASNNIRRHFPAIVDAHPEIPFAQAVGMRNMLSHGYFKVDLEVVWTSIQIDLPAFQSAIEALVVSLGQSQEAP